MKKSEMILKLTRLYGIRHVMVEGGYISPSQFMTEVLDYALHLGMKAPLDSTYHYATHDWEPETPETKRLMEVWASQANATLNKKKSDDDDDGNFPCGAV